MSPDVEFSVQERHGPVEICAVKGYKNDQRYENTFVRTD